MQYLELRVLIAAVLIALSPLACDFSPTAPFEGFDEEGSRISGIFTSGEGAGASLTAMPQSEYEGIRVYVEQDSTISVFVKSNGSFTLVGLPTGDVTVVFEKDGSVIGRLTFRDVVPNLEIRIVVTLNDSNRVELVEVVRDSVGLGECARGAGFWCRNKDGKNPNMPPEDFELYVKGALDRLQDVLEIKDRADIEEAVCNTGNQLLRQLTALALNLAAETVTEKTDLMGESYTSVADAFAAGIAAAIGKGSREETNPIKDVLDRINNNVNMAGDCEAEQDDDDEDDDSTVEIPDKCKGALSESGLKITICHNEKNTITISVNAWPAHQAHGDYCGPCT
jgi:hypothetical protein